MAFSLNGDYLLAKLGLAPQPRIVSDNDASYTPPIETVFSTNADNDVSPTIAPGKNTNFASVLSLGIAAVAIGYIMGKINA